MYTLSYNLCSVVITNAVCRWFELNSIFIFKNKRSNNVVIHGLPSTTGAVGTDREHVRDFIHVEICNSGFDWDIAACHRLGQRRGNKSGSTAFVNAAAILNADGSMRFLPLLVTLRCSQQAKYLVENARKLRHSTSIHSLHTRG